MFISIVIPAYNEAIRLKSSLEKLYSYLIHKDFIYEVVVIDDGSTDKTQDVALASVLHQNGKLNLLKNERNTGKGFSVKKGILAAQGNYILVSDADFSTPIEEIEKLLVCINSGFDIVIGSRSMPGADVQVHQPFYREFMGKVFNFLVHLFVLRGIKDTQCGFKLFKSDAAKVLASLLKINGFSFDVELLYLAKKRKFKIKEIPVIWINSPYSRVNAIADSFRMFLELLSIPRLHAKD
jgi:dolichyl-phosphate beta-glucosyltransferase